jgi:hypothetical protein
VTLTVGDDRVQGVAMGDVGGDCEGRFNDVRQMVMNL